MLTELASQLNVIAELFSKGLLIKGVQDNLTNLANISPFKFQIPHTEKIMLNNRK